MKYSSENPGERSSERQAAAFDVLVQHPVIINDVTPAFRALSTTPGLSCKMYGKFYQRKKQNSRWQQRVE